MVRKKTKLDLDALVERVKAKLNNHFNIDEMILFGSYAKGSENDLSDVDIAVVSPDLKENLAMFENVWKLLEKADIYEPYLQLVAFPSSIYNNEEEYVDPDFIREIKKTGKTLYSAVN